MPDFAGMGVMAPKSKYNFSDIPDMTGKVVIVTGANVSSVSVPRTWYRVLTRFRPNTTDWYW